MKERGVDQAVVVACCGVEKDEEGGRRLFSPAIAEPGKKRNVACLTTWARLRKEVTTVQ